MKVKWWLKKLKVVSGEIQIFQICGKNTTDLYSETVGERRKPRASEKYQFHQFLQAEYAFQNRFRILLE